tara:strand:- start:53 stop:382 length:330 start_codon:yes stop_codon:yes gene_type:complete
MTDKNEPMREQEFNQIMEYCIREKMIIKTPKGTRFSDQYSIILSNEGKEYIKDYEKEILKDGSINDLKRQSEEIQRNYRLVYEFLKSGECPQCGEEEDHRDKGHIHKHS